MALDSKLYRAANWASRNRRLLRIRPILKALQLRRAVTRLAQRWRPLRVLLAILATVTRNDVQQLTAGIAYYGIISLIPVSVVVVQILDLVLSESGTETWFSAISSGLLPPNVDWATLQPPEDMAVAGIAGALALLGLVWGSVKLFGAVGVVVNRMWGIQPIQVGILGKTREYMFLSATALVLLVSSILTSVTVPDLASNLLRTVQLTGLADVIAVQRWWPGVLAWLLSMTAFLLVYRFVPEHRVRWRWAALGALGASIGFEAVNYVFSLFLTYVAPSHLLYGPLASMFIFLIWLFVSGLILASGAALSAYSQSIYDGDGPAPGPGWFLTP